MGYTYTDSLRVHDTAVATWLAGLHVDYNTGGGLFTSPRDDVSILAVFGTPDRALANVADLLVRMGWVDGATDAEKRAKVSGLDVLPTPFITFYRGDPIIDPTMAGVPKHLRGTAIDPRTGDLEIHPYPGMYLTDYTVSAFSQRVSTDNHIRNWVYGQLGQLGETFDEVQIPVVHPSPWGTRYQSLKLTATTNTSEVEGEEPRYIRTEFVFTLRTWILKNPVTAWGQSP